MSRVRSVRAPRCLTLWVVLALATALVSIPSVAMASGVIGGFIRNGSAVAIPGIEVKFIDLASGLYVTSANTVTDGTGWYTATLPDGQYVMFLHSPDAAPVKYASVFCGQTDIQPPWFTSLVSDPITVSGAPVTREITMPLRSDTRVTVVRPDFTPVEGVWVDLHYRKGGSYTQEPYAELMTDASGQVRFTDVFPADYRTFAYDSGGPGFERYQSVFSPLPLPSYFTVTPASMPAEWLIIMKKLAVVDLSVAGGEGWQRDPYGYGEQVTLTRVSGDVAGTENVYYRVGPSGTDQTIGDVTTSYRDVTGEGEHLVEAWTIIPGDPPVVGPFSSKYVRIDNTPPATTANTGLHASQPSLVLAATDPLSGVDKRYYTLDGSGPTEYTAPVGLSTGAHSVTYWAVDVAGNVESAHTGTIVSGPQPGVSRPVGASSVRRNRYATYRGTLSKRVRNRSHLVLQTYKFNGVEWVAGRTKTVHITTPRRGKSRYSGSVKFTSKGSWRVVAYFKGDGTWAPAWSSGRSVRVR